MTMPINTDRGLQHTPFTIFRCKKCGSIRRGKRGISRHVINTHYVLGSPVIQKLLSRVTGWGYKDPIMHTQIIEVYEYEIGWDYETDPELLDELGNAQGT